MLNRREFFIGVSAAAITAASCVYYFGQASTSPIYIGSIRTDATGKPDRGWDLFVWRDEGETFVFSRGLRWFPTPAEEEPRARERI
jgi:hypothetical protein